MAMAAGGYSTHFSQMTLVDWLDDLTVRFLLNLPPAELSSVPRLCFQVEEAQWFYEDFIRPANPQLPSLNLRQFCMTLFQHCPLLSGFDAAQHLAAYEEFLAYKVRVPVRGAILMDETMEKVLLVRGWKKGASWSFPRGKINKDEKDIDCAIREVYEETGFDINAARLVQPNEENGEVKSFTVTMREQHMKLFAFRGVPLDTYFEPKTRKEISKIQWYNVKDLPGFTKNKGGPGTGQGEAHASKFYMVAPFLGQLKKWISQQRKRDAAGRQMHHHGATSAPNVLDVGITEDDGETDTAITRDEANVPVTSADELRRLLSIQQVPIDVTTSAHQTQPPELMKTHTGNLLAMLQGGPRSSSTQDGVDLNPPVINQFPHHITDGTRSGAGSTLFPHQHSSLMQTPSSAMYHYGQREQRLQSTAQAPAAGPSAFNPDPKQFSRSESSQIQQQSMPHLSTTFAPALAQNSTSATQNRGIQAPFNQFQSPPPFLPHPPPSSFLQQPSANLLAAFNSPQQHSPFDPSVSGPRVPEASKLPAPKLNAHSMKLLDAFKTTKSNSSASASADPAKSSLAKAGDQQQAVLLNLFRKTSNADQATSPGNKAVSVAKTTTPTPSNLIPSQMERRLTANEITRTIPPLKQKPKSPPHDALTIAARPDPNAPVQSKPRESTPASDFRAPRESLHPSHPTSSPRQQITSVNPLYPARHNHTSSQSRPVEHGSPAPAVSILQRPLSGQAGGSFKAADKRASQKSPTPQFSILQRPGSSAGKAARQAIPQSPLRNNLSTNTSQPQVLSRANAEAADDATVNTEKQVKSPTLPGKTDHLLALFGKASSTASTPQPRNSTPPASDPRANVQQRDMLLNLFDSGNTQRPIISTTSTPPPAPQLVPEKNPPRPSNSARQQNQQHLLSLISVQNSSSTGSPGTPISPFTLGTPITKFMPGIQALSENSGEPRSRLGSVASQVSNGTNSGRQTPTPSTVTPIEARGVLLDYLNGVVKEGYRGGKRPGL